MCFHRNKIEKKSKSKKTMGTAMAYNWLAVAVWYRLYDQLMAELRREGIEAFENFTRMPLEMYDDVLARVAPRVFKKKHLMESANRAGLSRARYVVKNAFVILAQRFQV